VERTAFGRGKEARWQRPAARPNDQVARRQRRREGSRLGHGGAGGEHVAAHLRAGETGVAGPAVPLGAFPPDASSLGSRESEVGKQVG
jgi:hypothetical protein